MTSEQVNPADLLMLDYQLKSEYLTAHYSRMWSRFNFFLTIQCAGFAFSLNADYARYVWLLSIGGLVIALAWYFFGANDNYLAEVYRRPIEHTYHLLRALVDDETLEKLPPDAIRAWNSVGNRRQTEYFDWENARLHRIRQNFFQHRWRQVSVTELTVVLPVLMVFLWVARIAAAYAAQ